ncbi:hypothetical protein BSL82_16360 [Tardibacter chloracetimidivorans]|uniref:Calcineurin-like phosphoesterase domain-containing protein n=1 Tax=Tardibacter chloracetimidivorans TaxID=1921510 RepID=A0A1L3ZYF7_9SPHN|nr:metallophosphoesterase [Tardibacter chloracetimidivorans]API60668.1 hypothetical protein BSL82_16360 [Tardibacter chloracetimidivorans]
MLAIFHAGWRQAMERPHPVSYALPRGGSGGSPPLTIAFLSDTHAGVPDMPPERLSRIVDQVNALAPDLILLGGDYVKGSPFGMGDIPAERAIAPLHGLRARLGVIAVLGNNDCADGQDDRIAGLLRTGGIRVLRNDVALLPGVSVLGVDDVIHCKGNLGPAKIAYDKQMRSRAGERARDFVILLAHEPAFAAFAPDYADLILAGHTHGGQMFPALTGRFVAHQNKLPAARGAMMVNGIPLVITSGVGTSNLPLRVGVPPEIVLLRIGPG